MSDKKKFFQASAGYALAQVIGIVVSLFSFPILTRILSVSEYGVLGLCSTSLLIGGAISKLGLQNSITRYYYEYRKRGELEKFYSTFWWGGAVSALLVTLILIPCFLITAPSGYKTPFLWVSILVFFAAISSVINNFLRVEERNNESAIVGTVSRVLTTAAGLALIYFWHFGISAIFTVQLCAALLFVLWYSIEFRSRYSLKTQMFSKPLFLEGLSFGAPLIAFELSSIGLAFSDRYLLTYYCGAEKLGVYTAGYTVCFYIADILRQPLGISVVPIYMRLYTDKGLEATIEFIREILGYVFLLIAPIFAGVYAIKHELLVMLASSKYAEAEAVIPWVLGSTLLYACQPLFAAGFTINKQTKLSSKIIVVGALSNVILNVLLLPRYGMIAAAWSTAFSYIAVLVIMTAVSSRTFPLSIPYFRILFYSCASLVMYLVIVSCGDIALPLKILIGIAVYTAIILLFDRKVAKEIKTLLLSRLKATRGVAG